MHQAKLDKYNRLVVVRKPIHRKIIIFIPHFKKIFSKSKYFNLKPNLKFTTKQNKEPPTYNTYYYSLSRIKINNKFYPSKNSRILN